MKIVRIESWMKSLSLSRPYTIAGDDRIDTDSVDLFFVRIICDRTPTGVGAATPAEDITGESVSACRDALAVERLAFLVGEDPRQLGTLCRRAEQQLADTPAARAAVDMALHDLCARILEVPVVELLGRHHDALPTSITIGIKSTEETLAEAAEYLGRGFRCLKVKVGRSLDEDLERLCLLRAKVGSSVSIRIDANEGYTVEETLRLAPYVEQLDLELVEQPLPASFLAEFRRLPESLRRRVALDESLHTKEDALELIRKPVAGAIHVIKLMKSGGITPARALADVAAAGRCQVMWGCMDESILSITAALHVAYASPATRYLDLDGSLDLIADPAEGGFLLVDGKLRTLDTPGLGVRVGRKGTDC